VIRGRGVPASLILFIALVAVPFIPAQEASNNPQHQAVLQRLDELGKLNISAWRFHAADLAHGEAPQLDDSRWQAVPKSPYRWKGGPGWLRTKLVVPAKNGGYDLTGAALRLDVDSDNDVIVYVNGSRLAMGEDLEPTRFAEHVKPGDSFVIAIKDLGLEGDHRVRFDIEVLPDEKRPDPLVLANELRSDETIIQALAKNDAQKQQQLDSAFAAVKLNSLSNADQSAFDQSIREAQSKLDPLRSYLQQYTIRASGNSHIDMAWLWPWSETVNVVRSTFGTALQLMNEYPDYTFSQSTAQASMWLEEKYPDLFAGIKQRVQEGRWELVGGMWVEPDLNMPDGESQVRQLLLGKRYFKEKFGKDIRIGWNPDSFGYNWQLPQIYKKSGIDYFVTQKLDWNDTTKPKYRMFWWQSPDGSKVLTYFPHDYVNSLEPPRMAGDIAMFVAKQPDFPEILHLYGIGDHGGGPTRVMLDRGERWSKPDVVFPKLTFGTAQAFFDDVEARLPQMKLPVIDNELYFQYHRGVFTSQAETKRHNRESEELMLNAEKFAAMDTLFGKQYPSAQLNYAWRKVLFNQFHDIAAGSGIAAIYKDADRDYEEIRHIAEDSIHQSLSDLAAHVNTGGNGVPILVFNPLGWKRSGIVEVEIELPKGGVPGIVDEQGKELVWQLLQIETANRWKLLLQADDIPPLGYRVYHAKVISGVGWHKMHATDTMLENELLRVKVDLASGCITSLFDKKASREAISPGSCGNLLQVFQDKPKEWDAWNIDADFENVKWNIDKAESVKLIQNGPLRSAIRVVRKFQNSTFTQDYTLDAGSPRLDIVTDADWHEKHILIKAAITPPVQSDYATYEIPYGSIQRPTTRNTPEEKAEFEVPAIRWGDLSDASFGVSLLNDCKYGYDAKGNVLRLSLLRAPTWPDPDADEGRHHFTYSFYPHAGDWKQADTVRQGYQLNYKLIAMQVDAHQGELPSSWSFAQLAPANLVLTALKKTEDSDALLFRFYEFAGMRGTATLTLSHPFGQAFETNLVETQGQPLKKTDNQISIPFGPYEIKTVKVEFEKVQQAAN
jgi:alpha-mannosidase